MPWRRSTSDAFPFGALAPDLARASQLTSRHRYTRRFFEGLLRPSVLTLAAFSAEGKLVAFVSGRVEATGWCGWHEEGYIMTLGVDAGFRRRKLGSYLLQRMISELRTSHEITDVTLHVQATNDAAMRLYSANGFQMIEHLRDYYEIDGELHAALKLLNRPADYHQSCFGWLIDWF